VKIGQELLDHTPPIPRKEEESSVGPYLLGALMKSKLEENRLIFTPDGVEFCL
jgi:hypothetical protein